MTIAPLSDEALDITSQDEAQRFTVAAQAIREWQRAQLPKLSDKALLAKFPKLGSTKTYVRVADQQDTTQLKDIGSKWMLDYEDIVRQIEAEREDTQEQVYEDMPSLQPILASVARLMQVTGNRRLIIIEGDTGHGKSFILRALKNRYGERAVLCEADESWFRASTAVGQLSLATKAVDNEAGLARQLGARINQLVAHNKGRRIIFIDEFHHCGGGTLNVIKTLINRTNCVIVVAGMKTLLAKLSAAAAEEARQLTHNRLFARHTLTGPSVEDASLFFERRLGVDLSNKQITTAIGALISQKGGGGRTELVAAHLGGMAFLRNVAEFCRDLVGDGPIDATTLIEAANAAKQQATGR